MTQLHDELARIGDAAPPVAPTPDLAPDLWRRGRRARTRDRLVAAGAVVALVVALGGIATAIAGGPPRILPADRPAPGAPGVPTSLSATPEWVVQLPESGTGEVAWAPELDAVSDLAVGQAAAAFAAGEYGRLAVVVTAADGRYLPLELPGFADAGSINTGGGDGSALALSPDGTRLAYAWWAPLAPLDAPMPAGVRVVDLTTGELTTTTLRGGNGVDVDRISWSPNGTWLAWSGDQTTTWTPMSRSSRDVIGGRIRVDSTTSQALTGPTIDAFPAIADDGTVAFWNGSRVVVSSGEDTERVRVDDISPGLVGGAVFSADGETLSLSEGSFGNLPRLDVPTGRVAFLAKPSDYPESTEVRPLGWTADGGLVVVSRDTLTLDTPGRLAVVGPRGHWRDVGEVEQRAVGSLSLATDLMTSARPTVDRPDPDWPWSLDRKVAVGCVSAVTLWLTGLFVWTRRRRW